VSPSWERARPVPFDLATPVSRTPSKQRTAAVEKWERGRDGRFVRRQAPDSPRVASAATNRGGQDASPPRKHAT
jgi:hypothetical protein